MLARILIASTVLALAPTAAAAQFTTFVPPNRPVATSSVAQEAAVARADTARRQTLSEMTAWVDSAAGTVSVSPATDTTVRDSATAAVAVDSAARPVAEPGATTAFQEGARAPNTASPLPVLSALGTLLLLAGLLLVRFERLRVIAPGRRR